MESLQHKLDRIRKPRVHITYDVEIGSAIEKKELAFVVGILADLSGHREDDIRPLPPVKKRKFVEIDRDNFNHVMEAIKPHLHMVVPNHLGTKEKEIAFDFYFSSLDDFDPLSIVKNNEALKTIYDTRNALKDMLAKMDGNEPLENLVRQAVADPKVRADLKAQVNAELDKIRKVNTAAAAKADKVGPSAAGGPAAEPPKEGGK